MITVIAATALCSPPPSSDLAARIALLESLLAQPKLNDGRRAWARAELKRLKGK
jgi:hypothetical protein